MSAHIGITTFSTKNYCWDTVSSLTNQRGSRTNGKEKAVGQQRLILVLRERRDSRSESSQGACTALSSSATMFQQRDLMVTSLLGWWREAQRRQQSVFSHNNSYCQRGGCPGHSSHVHWDSLLWIRLWGYARSKCCFSVGEQVQPFTSQLSWPYDFQHMLHWKPGPKLWLDSLLK